MVSTVTTTTVSTVASVTTVSTTTTSAVASASLLPSTLEGLALVTIVSFLVLLLQKEVVCVATQGWQRIFARGLNIGLVPLGLASGMIVVEQVMRVLS